MIVVDHHHVLANNSYSPYNSYSPSPLPHLQPTLPSMTATHELVVPRSMPMTSPAARAAVVL